MEKAVTIKDDDVTKMFVIRQYKAIGFLQFTFWLAKKVSGQGLFSSKNINNFLNVKLQTGNGEIDSDSQKLLELGNLELIGGVIDNIIANINDDELPLIFNRIFETVTYKNGEYEFPLKDCYESHIITPMAMIMLAKDVLLSHYSFMFEPEKKTGL
jgi:hypothetical protein